jgi:type II secretory pathway pseudopilin PulG
VDSITASADLAFLDAAQPDAKKAKSCLRDLQALPSMALMADKISLTERFMFLDTVMQLDFHGVGHLDELAGGKGDNPAMKIAFRDVHWDTALRNGNGLFSRLSAAMRLKDRAMREKELHEIELEIKTRKANLTSAEEFLRTLLTTKNVGDAKGKYVGEILITLLVPAVVKVQHAADRSEQAQQNLHIAFALAAYKSDQGRFPKALDALAPKYLATVPIDLFTGKALIYRPSETGYLFYSVGINGKDEQGRSFDDDPRGDDLPVRMPLPKAREKK